MHRLGCPRRHCGSGVPREGKMSFALRRCARTSAAYRSLPPCAGGLGRERSRLAVRPRLTKHSRAAVLDMTALAALIRRDIKIALRVGGGSLLGVLFFLTVGVLMPFAVGPDLALLTRLGRAYLWLGALPGSQLTLDRHGMARQRDG